MALPRAPRERQTLVPQLDLPRCTVHCLLNLPHPILHELREAACPQICARSRTDTRAVDAMPPTRALRRQEGGWAQLPKELVAKVLELLQAEEGGLGFSKPSAVVRLVCSGWKRLHDALVMRLVLNPQTTDEAMGMLVLRFPAVESIEFKNDWNEESALTDEGVRAVCNLPAIAFLNLYGCNQITDEALRAVSWLPSLTSLNLGRCRGVRARGCKH